MAKYVLICETIGCANEGVSVVLETDATNIGCGPCGEVITNVSESSDV